jgi:hypothetical protein
VALLGFLLDPEDPAASDQQIAERLLERSARPEDVLAEAARFAGRCVVVASSGDRRLLFQDAGGFRALCHATRPDGAVVCASEPRLAAELAGAELDPAARAFMDSPAFRALWGRHWWPAPRTPFLGVRRLSPNSALDLQRGTAFRHWPSARLASLSVGEAAREGARLLRGILRAAARRYPLSLFVTAGWDSRLVLAAAREVADQLECISIHYPGGETRDVEVASDLLQRLGVAHRIVHAAEKPSAAFGARYGEHAFLAHEPAAAIAEAVLPVLRGERVAMTGHLSEILKGYYTRPRILGSRLPAETLAALAAMQGSGYAETAFAEWLAGVDPAGAVHPLDLFYWEQNAGSQHATWMLEWDLVWRDCLVPLDCRRLLELLLRVPYRHRRIGELHRRLMVELWPEVLQVPLKGRRFPDRARSSAAEDALRNLRFVAKELKHGLGYLRRRRAGS